MSMGTSEHSPGMLHLSNVIMDPPSRKISKPRRDLSSVVLTLENAITAPQFCTIYERDAIGGLNAASGKAWRRLFKIIDGEGGRRWRGKRVREPGVARVAI